MIRKTIIVVLTLGALTSGALFVLSGYWSFECELREYREVVGEDLDADGKMRIAPFLAVYARCGALGLYFTDTIRYGGHPGNYCEWVEYNCESSGLFHLPSCSTGPGVLVIRLPFGLLILLFGTYPGIAFIRGPLRSLGRARTGGCSGSVTTNTYDRDTPPFTGANVLRVPASGFFKRGFRFWLLFLGIPLIVTFIPTGFRRQSMGLDSARKATGVTCTRYSWELGLPPFHTLCIAWHEWTVVDARGNEVTATDVQVDAFLAILRGTTRPFKRNPPILSRFPREWWYMLQRPRDVAYTFNPFIVVGNLALWIYVESIVLRARRRWRVARTEQRQRKGLCRQCGYNLAGNVSGICPECGCATESLGKEECDMGCP